MSALRIRWTQQKHICDRFDGCITVHEDPALRVSRWTFSDGRPTEFYIAGDDEWVYESEWELLHYLKNEKHPGKTPRLAVFADPDDGTTTERWVWE